jgi:GNAT superfamily N-acetyltransferase
MPAMLDDPTSPPILHKLDAAAHTFTPQHVTLKDGTPATILPFTSLSQVPASLVAFLHAQLSAEIEGGDTYPMLEALPLENFGSYWFGVFGAVMLAGEVKSAEEVKGLEADWERVCLGSFYTKPNYPGRSSHVCNAGFLVTGAARNKGVGKLLGRQYLEWAPKLVWFSPFVFFLPFFYAVRVVHSSLTCMFRDSRTRCSTWCMRRMWLRRVSGIRWALRGLVA